MADVQKEHGHVDIANGIVEALAKTHLSSYETQVLFAILRKTYGWHKKEDWITNTQIADMTGIAEAHISRTIKLLLQKNIIYKNGKKLAIQKDYEKWVKLPKGVTSHHGVKLPKGDIKLPKGVIEVTKGGKKKLPKGVYTKETKRNYTKETIQKKGDVFLKAWKDFKEMRKKIKKPMTDRAEEMLLTSLNELSKSKQEQVAILNQSTFHCWQGVYALKDKPVDDEVQPKWEKKEVLKLTPEQVERNKAKMKELANVFKGKFTMPGTAEGG
uniref:Putative DNA replication initiation protein n=1 Tax=viral metagenome TaxID=1070528 RepID=A0A6M3KBP9_9ZZZZ